MPAGLEECQTSAHTHACGRTHNTPGRVPERAKVTRRGDGRVTMPTGLTDVNEADLSQRPLKVGPEA